MKNENNHPIPSHESKEVESEPVKSAESVLSAKEGYRGNKNIYHYTVAIEAMETYASQLITAPIEVIKKRLEELEALEGMAYLR